MDKKDNRRISQPVEFFLARLIFMLLAFYELFFSDAFFAPYCCVFISAMFCAFSNRKLLGTKGITDKESVPDSDDMPNKESLPAAKRVPAAGRVDRRSKRLIRGCSLLLTLMVVAANYNLWSDGGLKSMFLCLILFVGTLLAWGSILYWIALRREMIVWEPSGRWSPGIVFLTVFLCISGVNLLLLFLCKYPGNLTTDSIRQMTQVLTGLYRNHHPVCHTLTIGFFVNLGFSLFHEINAAVAVYSVFSILFMAASFAFCATTMTQLRVPNRIVALTSVLFGLMPYHIMYSMTMWKDVLFGAFTLLFILFFFRCIRQMGRPAFRWIGLFLSGLGICLYRSNGFFAFVLTVLCFFALWRFRFRKMLFVLLGIIICAFIVKHPVLKALDIPQADLVESLSIPVQQMSRDVIENDDFTEDQLALLEEVIELDRVADTYKPYISDPIKGLIRDKDNQTYLVDHAGDYAALYLKRLFKHPSSYLKAWIDQTKGYWNAGYPYWRWLDMVMTNDLGIERTVRCETLNTLVDRYLTFFEDCPPLQIFVSIGLFDWLLLLVLFIAVLRRDKLGVLLTVPMIANVVSLLIATPVFSEMRYNYAVFCALPVAAVLVLRPEREDGVRAAEKETAENEAAEKETAEKKTAEKNSALLNEAEKKMLTE